MRGLERTQDAPLEAEESVRIGAVHLFDKDGDREDMPGWGTPMEENEERSERGKRRGRVRVSEEARERTLPLVLGEARPRTVLLRGRRWATSWRVSTGKSIVHSTYWWVASRDIGKDEQEGVDDESLVKVPHGIDPLSSLKRMERDEGGYGVEWDPNKSENGTGERGEGEGTRGRSDCGQAEPDKEDRAMQDRHDHDPDLVKISMIA
jgi:hypothetical protein